MMEFNAALDKILENFSHLKSEILPIGEAFGRILGEDVVAGKNLPCFDNSALDGYAVKFDEKDRPYRVIDAVFAGDKSSLKIGANECVKIMTGAKIPLGADTIMRFEDCEEKDGFVVAPANLKRGEAYRFAGEEVKAGEILMRAGERLDAARIMMLAAQGISFVGVFCAPRVGIFSSGDEIVEPWQSADADRIYNANAAGIAALLKERGFASSYLGVIKDELDATVKAFEGARNFDVLISSGGASKGEADFMKTALTGLGFSEIFGRVNMRPGGPCKAYAKEGKIVFALPGNPMAAFLCAHLFVLPALLGRPAEREKAVISEDLKLKGGRANIVLGRLEDGVFHVTDGNKFGSGMIKPLIKSNSIYVADSERSALAAGDEIFVTRIS